MKDQISAIMRIAIEDESWERPSWSDQGLFFCILALAAKDLISEAHESPEKQRWMDGMTVIAPTLAYRGELEVISELRPT